MANPAEPIEPPEILQIRISGPPSGPNLIYLPGIHGDWTLVTPFRLRISRSVRFVEFTYPRTLEWSLSDYAENLLAELSRSGITGGWLLAESFGSQLAWALCEALQGGPQPAPFRLEGIILAGGFTEYPMKRVARMVEALRSKSPRQGAGWLMWLYATLLKVRFRGSPDARMAAKEFLARRTPRDSEAILHRLRLLIGYDPASAIAALEAPVFYLSGLFDPIVPWFLVRHQLRRVSPSFQEAKIILTGDHNVLGTAPAGAERQILKWINRHHFASETATSSLSLRAKTERPAKAG